MGVVSEVTLGINVMVETFFQSSQSRPMQSHYVFLYRIKIINSGSFTVQLKRRHWNIFDSNGVKTQVEGAGVVGEQPILKPGQSYQYVSGCNLQTEMGNMHGKYVFERQMDGERFDVKIPKFTLYVPYKNN